MKKWDRDKRHIDTRILTLKTFEKVKKNHKPTSNQKCPLWKKKFNWV